VLCGEWQDNENQKTQAKNRAWGTPPITTEGDEMKIARSIKSPQRIACRFFHTNRQVKIRTLKTEGCGTRPPALASTL
jgi:hypothetical protein